MPVHALLRWLLDQGIRSKSRTSSRGKVMGGGSFGRGALFHLLKNRTYVGEVPHRDKSYPGLHAPIIDREMFDRVQGLLASQTRARHERPLKVATMALRGLIFDADGHPMSPSFTGRQGRSYRYYVSTPLLRGSVKSAEDDAIRRVGADRVENVVKEVMARLWADPASEDLTPLVRVELHAQTLQIVVRRAAFFARHGDGRAQFQSLRSRLAPGEWIAAEPHDDSQIRITLTCRLKAGGGKIWFEGGVVGDKPRPDRGRVPPRGVTAAV